ncbi:MAG: FtsL-like putative cell division protein [Bacteroidia bacterium]|nr:FtsL-like putative cell division protein [Bacteroidia bacterium]MDW8134347.1 FtsL-like putative cell division protein [Bacteroidia bacterium]
MRKAIKTFYLRLNPFYWLPKHVSLLLYIAFWIIIYVATQYRAEIKVRELHRLRKALSEKRAEYLQLNANVSQKRSYSALKPALDSLGLYLPEEPPIFLSLQKNE